MSAAPAPNPYVLRLERLEALVREQADEIASLKRTLAAVAVAFGGGGPAGGGAATDRELDHPQHGDPSVAFVPRDWTAGGVVKGQKYSRCPAEFLELLAEAYDSFAEKNDREGIKDSKGKPKSGWDRKSARMCRGWARRLRAGWTPPPAPAAPTFGGTSEGFGSGKPFGFGTTASWGSDGSSSNGRRGFLGAAPPAAPSSEPKVEPNSADDDSFAFGANVGKPDAQSTATTDEDDDPPL